MSSSRDLSSTSSTSIRSRGHPSIRSKELGQTARAGFFKEINLPYVPKHTVNRSIPIIQHPINLAQAELGRSEGATPEAKIVACIIPTWADHRLLYVLDFRIHSPPKQVIRKVPAQEILKWVTHEELTRFEHQRCQEEQAHDDFQPPKKQRGRPSKHFGLLQPLESSSGVDSSSSDEEIRHPPPPASKQYSGPKRPRGRPPKNAAAIEIRVASQKYPVEQSSDSALSSTSRKRRRSSSQSPKLGNASRQDQSPQREPGVASTGRLSRRDGSRSDHVSLPQTNRRLKKAKPMPGHPIDLLSKHDTRSEAFSEDVSRLRIDSEVNNNSDDYEMIYHPAIVYSDHDNEDGEYSDQDLVQKPTAFTYSRSLAKTDQRPTATKRSHHVQSSHDVRRSHDVRDDTTDVTINPSSDEDELAALHEQFQATASNHLRYSGLLPKVSQGKANSRPVRSLHQQDHDLDIPPGGREASLDLGATSESEKSIETPIGLKRPSDSDHAIIRQLPVQSGGMPARFQQRSPQPFGESHDQEIVEISDDEETGTEEQLNLGIEKGFEIPNIPSSQSFQASDSSSSSSSSEDELNDTTLQKSEGIATSGPLTFSSRGIQSSRAAKQPIISKSAERIDRGRSDIAASKSTSAKSAELEQISSSAAPRNEIYTQQSQPSRRPNPVQQFAKVKHPSAEPRALASMGAGAAFPTAFASQSRQPVVSTYGDPNAQLTPFGRPLPLHPTTPPRAPKPYSRSTNGKSTQSRPSTSKKQRRSMTPLYPRGAIIPDLTSGAPFGSPSKKRPLIFSTMQFQE